MVGEFCKKQIDFACLKKTKSYVLFFIECSWNRKYPSHSENLAEIKNDTISCIILHTLLFLMYFLTGIFAVDCFNHTALRQITRMRIKYFESMIRQEIGWYDVADGSNNYAVRITE